MRIRFTVPHVYDFGPDRDLVGDDLVRPGSWDALRLGTAGPFSLPDDRQGWEAQARAAEHLAARAYRIQQWSEAAGARRLASYGVGTALLEFHLHRLAPELELTVTDYAPRTVGRLRKLFDERVSVQQHDLLSDGPLDAELHLMHRVDSELTDAQWRGVLDRFSDARLLIVATEVAGLGRALRELAFRVRRPSATRAGWLRTRGAFEALWPATHVVTPMEIDDLAGWDLRPRQT